MVLEYDNIWCEESLLSLEYYWTLESFWPLYSHWITFVILLFEYVHRGPV